MNRKRAAFLSLFCAVSCFASEADNSSPRPRLAVPCAATPPRLTAEADDSAWTAAARIAGLEPSLSAEAIPAPTPATEVRVLWDERFLYVRFLCRDDETYLPVHGQADRSVPVFRDDAVEVFIDPGGDARQWVELQVNSVGEAFVQLFLCTGEPRFDAQLRMTAETTRREVWEFPGWNLPGLRTAAAPWPDGGRAGWIVDVAVPAAPLLKRLGADHFSPGTLRADFLRYDWPAPAHAGGERKLASTNWSPVAFGAPHRSPAAYGCLDLSPRS